jgi:hypothetical protein
METTRLFISAKTPSQAIAIPQWHLDTRVERACDHSTSANRKYYRLECSLLSRKLREKTVNKFPQSTKASNSRIISTYRPSTSIRTLSISSRFLATSQPTVTDAQAPADPVAKGDLLKDAPTAVQLARQLRKRATGTTETYVAYGSTESLYKLCAAQANYDIPQRREKDGIVPTSPTGEELGVGDGWWYTGTISDFHDHLRTARPSIIAQEMTSVWLFKC